MRSNGRRRLLLQLAAVIVGIGTSSARAVDPTYLQQESPDVVFTTAIEAKAAELDHDPARIYEFVRNEIRFEVYYGLKKGPEDTLFSGAGNDYDLAALLVSLLRTSGVPARFVRGKVLIPAQKAQGWIGATPTPSNAAAGVNRLLRNTQPVPWLNNTNVGTRMSGTNLEVLHIWVEAYVPMGSYRGAGGAASLDSRGPAWIPLDPSFKLHEWNTDPALPLGEGSLAFDYTGTEGYYQSVHSKLPLEVFEDQVRGYLADTPASAVASVDDAAFSGRILKERAGVLPNALPYAVNETLPVRRAASLVALHQAASNDPFALAGMNGGGDYRYERLIHLCIESTPNCETLAPSNPAKVLEARGWSAAWQGTRVTIWFPPTTASAPLLRPEGYAYCTGHAGPIWTVPTVSVNGNQQAAASTTVRLCDPLELVIEVRDPLDVWNRGPDLLPAVDFDIAAGELFVASFDEGGASPTRVAAAATTLAFWSSVIPLAHDPEEDLAFIDLDKDGVKDANEKYLSADPYTQEILTGGLLHLAHSWYWNEYRRSERRLTALHQAFPANAPGLGRVTSGREIEYLFGVPFGIEPSNLLVDLAAVAQMYQRDGFPMAYTSSPAPELLLHQGSALEHAVWEEVAGVGAVSTVQGFQLALELAEPAAQIGLLPTLITASQAQAEILARCNSQGCNKSGSTGMDQHTYCTIRRSFTISQDPPGWAGLCAAPFSGTTQGLRILNKSNTDYAGWNGFVFMRWTASSGTMGISPTANGGFAREGSSIDPRSAAPNEIYPFDAKSWKFVLPTSTNVWAGDPVSVTQGSYFESHVDLEIPGPGGLDFRVVRSYNSRVDYAGDLGHGWIHTYDQHLREDAGGPQAGDESVVWVTENATEEPWDDEGTELTPQPWNHHDLTRSTDGSYLLRLTSGMVYRFLAADSEGIARLQSIEDRNGNTITCTRTPFLLRVTDSAGRDLDFHYEFSYLPPFRLDRIEDWTGRIWDYEIDENDDLVAYTDPEDHVWSYEYYGGLSNSALNHNLKSFERPALRGSDDHYAMTFVYYPNDSVFKHTDALGRVTRFSYNFFRKRTDAFQPDGSVETYFYDEYGNVTRFESAEGVVTEYGFESPEKRERTSEIDGLGFETALTYDAEGNLDTRTDRLGATERWTGYNAFGQPSGFIDRRGSVRGLVYDSDGNLEEEWRNLTKVRSHGYDPRGNRTSTTEELGDGRSATTIFDYDPSGSFLVKVTDAEQNETRITPDALGRPVRTETDRSVGPPGAPVVEPVVVTRTFDALGRVTSETDPAGTTREIEFDENGLVREMRSVVPQPGQAGPLVRIDLQNTYDKMDRLIATTDALGRTTTHQYDDRDRRTHTTSALGRVAETVYDLDGRVVAMIDPSGARTTIDYDPVSRPIRVVDALGRESRTEYDAEGRVQRRIEPGERVVFKDPVYDPAGNLKEWRDAEEVLTRQSFDQFGRRETLTVAVFDPEEATVQYDFDIPGRLIEKIDGEGHSTRVGYDLVGRVETVTDATNHIQRTATYDELGNLRSVTDGDARSVERDYDPRGLVLEERQDDGTTARYRYDALGRLVWSRGPDEAVATYGYDDLDRLTTVTTELGGTERFVYDEDGLLRQHVQPSALTGAAGPLVLNYDYDARGLLTLLRDPEAGAFLFEADALGRPVRHTGPGGADWRADYTPEGFLASIAIDLPGAGDETITYGNHDDRGYPATITSGADLVTLAYTDLGRLASADYPGTTFDEEFTYDRAGNRKTRTAAGATVTYVYDAADRLTQIKAAGGAVLESFGHDGAGRRTSRTVTAPASSTTYGYDAHGRLSGVTRTGSDPHSASFAYGASGQRSERTEGGATSRYPTPRLEQRGATTFRLLRAGALGEVVAEVAGPAGDARSRALVRDGSANVGHVVVTDDEGTSTLEASPRRWSAFGTLRAGGTSVLERGYASQAREGGSGLVLMGARHYDPATGRFLQPDPLGILASELYAYAANNPYMFWDPTGLRPISHSAGSGSFSTASSSGVQYADAGTVATDALYQSQSAEARRDAVIAGGGGDFQVSENPNANPYATWYESSALGNAAVGRYANEIDAAARGAGIDANLLRTAVYLENSRGYYDALTGPLNKSIRPANINVNFWGPSLGLTRAQLNDPATNLAAGARILSGIQANLAGGNIRAVGTLYNSLGATTVNSYGARFGAIYSIQPWSLR